MKTIWGGHFVSGFPNKTKNFSLVISVEIIYIVKYFDAFWVVFRHLKKNHEIHNSIKMSRFIIHMVQIIHMLTYFIVCEAFCTVLEIFVFLCSFL